MIVNLNINRLQLDEITVAGLKESLAKLSKYLPHFDKDLQLNLFIKKSHHKFHAGSDDKKHSDYLDTKLKLSNFEGWIKLTLPKKVLYAQFESLTVPEGIKTAKKRLLEEIKKYKDLHFKSQSQHPHHETIRGAQ